MSDSSRLEDLRRRVQKEPDSLLFGQLAEEYRRTGRYADAVETCRAGLENHPGYLSARVTLGCALIELGRLDEAQRELERVRTRAPENLTVIRALADIRHRRGALQDVPSPGSAFQPSPVSVTDRAHRTIAKLEQWLAAIHVARAHRRA